VGGAGAGGHSDRSECELLREWLMPLDARRMPCCSATLRDDSESDACSACEPCSQMRPRWGVGFSV
jgi:hypothetical protein